MGHPQSIGGLEAMFCAAIFHNPTKQPRQTQKQTRNKQ